MVKHLLKIRWVARLVRRIQRRRLLRGWEPEVIDVTTYPLSLEEFFRNKGKRPDPQSGCNEPPDGHQS